MFIRIEYNLLLKREICYEIRGKFQYIYGIGLCVEIFLKDKLLLKIKFLYYNQNVNILKLKLIFQNLRYRIS